MTDQWRTGRVEEKNPFTRADIAAEWIDHIKKESGLRSSEVYPLVSQWSRRTTGVFVDIGSGDGICAEKISLTSKSSYIGVEPSSFLLKHAHTHHSGPNRAFRQGDAYAIPLSEGVADGCLSIGVWYHLADLKAAAREMARILKRSGRFLIVTANPPANDLWRSRYIKPRTKGKQTVGTVRTEGDTLSEHVFYAHTQGDLFSALTYARLAVHELRPFGRMPHADQFIFTALMGVKE